MDGMDNEGFITTNADLKRSNTDSLEENRSKKPARDPRLSKPKIFNIPTANQFEALSNLATDVGNDSTTSSLLKDAHLKISKPPPIYLKSAVDFKQLCSILQTAGGDNSFKCVSTSRGITIYPSTPDAYRIFVKLFKEKEAEFHTFQLNEDKSYRVVIRGLHPTIPHEDIAKELSDKGFSVRKISNVFSKAKTSLPLYFVDLDPNTNNDAIFEIDSLLYSKIKVEEPRKKRQIVQCVKCQQYGHTKSYCYYKTRCVKCGKQHEPAACTKKTEDQPTCANCGGNHPANYRGCIIHKQLQTAKRRPSMRQQQAANPASPPQVDSVSFPALPGQSPRSSQNLTQRSDQPSNSLNKNFTNRRSYSLINNSNNFHDFTNNSSYTVSSNSQNSNVSYSQIVNNPYHLTSPHVTSSHHPSSSHTETIIDTTSLSSLLAQLQQVIQPLFSLVTQLTQLTQALLKSNGR